MPGGDSGQMESGLERTLLSMFISCEVTCFRNLMAMAGAVRREEAGWSERRRNLGDDDHPEVFRRPPGGGGHHLMPSVVFLTG